MDFTHAVYKQLLSAIRNSAMEVYTVERYLTQKEHSKGIILRHDVELHTRNALELAKIESSFAMPSTYYFRVPRTFNIETIRHISGLGHEIGYHYETLDKTSGDYALAAELFIRELSEFRERTGIKIKTVCAHGGRPYDGGDKIGYQRNLDLFERYPNLLKESHLVGEAYLDIDFSRVAYFSDSGARWNRCKKTQEIIKHIESGAEDTIYILAHPDWWHSSIGWVLLREARGLLVPHLLKVGILRDH